MPDRDPHLDNAKGILILLVLTGHLIWPTPNPDKAANAAYLFIYAFHMPMFALVSGFLSHATWDRMRLVSEARRFLAPYAVFIALQYGLLTLLGQSPQPVIQGHYGLWFLLSLWCWRLLLPLLARLPFVIWLTIALSMCSGLLPWMGLDFSLARTVNFLPFFMAGHLMRQRGCSPVAAMPKWAATGLALLAVPLAMHLSQWDIQSILWGGFSYQAMDIPFWFGMTARALQLTAAFGLGLAALALVPKTEGMLTRFGRHSLPIYLLHTPLLVVYRALPEIHASIGQFLPAILASAPLIAWLLSSGPVIRWTRWLVSPCTGSR